MGDISKIKPKRNITFGYYVNDDGSVTKKTATKPHTQTSSFIVNEDGSVTKRTKQRNATRYTPKPKSTKVVEDENISGIFSSMEVVGTIIYIIANIIFFVLLIINTYEEGETIVDWIEILAGLSLFSYFLYRIIIHPILNWLEDIF